MGGCSGGIRLSIYKENQLIFFAGCCNQRSGARHCLQRWGNILGGKEGGGGPPPDSWGGGGGDLSAAWCERGGEGGGEGGRTQMRKMRKVFLAPLPLKQVILKLSFCLCSVLFLNFLFPSRHMKLHSGIKPFACTVRLYVFERNLLLRNCISKSIFEDCVLCVISLSFAVNS